MNPKHPTSRPGNGYADSANTRILVIEDSPKDLKDCIRVLHNLGVTHIDTISTVPAAIFRLEQVLDENEPAPHLIILDLSFSVESGFEVLRRWKAEPRLKNIPVIVWTAMGGTERKLCEYFGVQKIIPKWEGLPSLEKALKASV